MDKDDQIALVIEWDEGVFLPSVVGPFPNAVEATKWAELNIPNGTWELHAMRYPYLRSPGRDVRLV